MCAKEDARRAQTRSCPAHHLRRDGIQRLSESSRASGHLLALMCLPGWDVVAGLLESAWQPNMLSIAHRLGSTRGLSGSDLAPSGLGIALRGQKILHCESVSNAGLLAACHSAAVEECGMLGADAPHFCTDKAKCDHQSSRPKFAAWNKQQQSSGKLLANKGIQVAHAVWIQRKALACHRTVTLCTHRWLARVQRQVQSLRALPS